MKIRTLSNGPEVSALGLGCMSMTSTYGSAAVKASMIKLIRSAHEQVVITTKFGFDIDLVTGAYSGPHSRPEHIRAVAEASLKRLRTDCIDLLYQHRVDPQVPIKNVAVMSDRS